MTDAAEDNAKIQEMFDVLGHHGMDERPLSSVIEAKTSNEDLSKRLRCTKITNSLLIKDEKEAKKVDDRFADLDRFETPLGLVTIGHIPPSKDTLQNQDQKEFVTGSRVELLLENNVTIVEKRSMEGVTLQLHARNLRANDANLTKIQGMAVRDVITLPELVDQHFGDYAAATVEEAYGHILITLAKTTTQAAEEIHLPRGSATPMIAAAFERMSPYDRKMFAEALESDSVYDARIGAGIIRKKGSPGAMEITHIDPETLTQLREENGTRYSIKLAQTLASHLILQLEGMPVRSVSQMEDWMDEIFGDKIIKQILNAGGNCTIELE